MAVDTANKRASILGTFSRPLVIAPTPDSAFGSADRQQLAGLYILGAVVLDAVGATRAVSTLPGRWAVKR